MKKSITAVLFLMLGIVVISGCFEKENDLVSDVSKNVADSTVAETVDSTDAELDDSAWEVGNCRVFCKDYSYSKSRLINSKFSTSVKDEGECMTSESFGKRFYGDDSRLYTCCCSN